MPDPQRLSDDELAEIRSAFAGCTKYEGRRIPWDERLLADRDALAREVRELRQEVLDLTQPTTFRITSLTEDTMTLEAVHEPPESP